MDVLVVLAETSPDVVSSDQLLDLVWPGVVVGDNVVHRAVTQLRKALGDQARAPRYIEHIPRRGYRLLVEVTPLAGTSSEGRTDPEPRHGLLSFRALPFGVIAAAIFVTAVAGWLAYEHTRAQKGMTASAAFGHSAPGELSRTPESSLAVLPFLDLSPGKDNQFLADGIAEEILTALSESPELLVIARGSSFAFRDQNLDIGAIARKLNVSHVLEGSVRLAGEQLRIDVRLVDASTSAQRWSHAYDGRLSDLFAVQSDIARNVADRLQATLLTRNRAAPPHPDVYMPFLQARHLLYESDLAKLPEVKALLDEALTRDASFTGAWLQVPRIHQLETEAGQRPWIEGWQLARDAVERARAIEPNSSAVHAWLAWTSMFLDGDLVSAANHLESSLAGGSTDAGVLLGAVQALVFLGRPAEAIAFGEQLIALDPLCGICFSSLGKAYLLAGQLDDAEAVARRSVPLWSDPRRLWQLGNVLLLKGRPADALAVFSEIPSTAHEHYNGVGVASHALGRMQDYRSAFVELQARCAEICPELIGHVHAWTGHPDQAFEWLGRRAREPEFFGWSHWFMPLRPLHGDPRWRAFLEQQGQSPEQLAAIPLRVNLPQAPGRDVVARQG
jgi:TolB-like protein